jgi:hypothetical protein
LEKTHHGKEVGKMAGARLERQFKETNNGTQKENKRGTLMLEDAPPYQRREISLGPLGPPTDRLDFTHLVPGPGDSQTVTGNISLPADGCATGQWLCRVAARDYWFIVSLSQGTKVT